MAELSEIKIDGVTYDIMDATARKNSMAEYELIETITVSEEGLQEIRTTINLCAMILAIEIPVVDINKDAHCTVYTSTNENFYTGGALFKNGYAQSARYAYYKSNGVWESNFCVYPNGWGGGPLMGPAKAGKIVFANQNDTLTSFRLYTSGEAYFPVGMTIKIYGVRA